MIVGSAARDHALAWKLVSSPRVAKVYVAPGNGGTAAIATNVDISVSAYDKLIDFAKDSGVNLVYISGDDQLGDGLVDMLQAAGITAFGPTQAAARIESSKAFSKQLMTSAHIPTASFQTIDDYEKALKYVQTRTFPVVVKASGLAGGKGALICNSHEDAETALTTIMRDHAFGESGDQVVIEDFLEGPEISIHAFCDGTSVSLFPPSQDHKAIKDGNTGPNTGGMGVIAPLPGVSTALMGDINRRVVTPALASLKSKNSAFVGILYPGVMLTNDGPMVLEYNARPGDPETQAYMRILKTDLVDIVEACLQGTLNKLTITWSDQTAANIVLASNGYPDRYEKGKVISGIESAEHDPDVIVFHGGTTLQNGQLITNGGRVLSVTAVGDDLDSALAKAYAAADKITFEGKTMRKDIGKAHDNSKLEHF